MGIVHRTYHVRSLASEYHEPVSVAYANGLTAFSAIGTCIESSGKVPSTMPWPDSFTHSAEQLDGLRETTRRMSAMAEDLEPLSGQPLANIGKSEWSPSWSDELSSASKLLDTAIQSLTERTQVVSDFIRHPTLGMSLEGYAALDQLADVLLAAPKVPEGLARQAHDIRVRAMVQSLAKHGAARSAHRERTAYVMPTLVALSVVFLCGFTGDTKCASYFSGAIADR